MKRNFFFSKKQIKDESIMSQIIRPRNEMFFYYLKVIIRDILLFNMKNV
jgi:hypothetical protein